MTGLEELLRKGVPFGLVAALSCTGNQDSAQPDDTGRDSSYTDDSGTETGDSGHTGDTDTYTTHDAPVIDTSTLRQTAYLNTPFTYTVTATQDTDAGTLTCRIDELPFDVTYSNNGCTMSFTVTDEFRVGENYNISVEVEDSYGKDEASLELTIANSSTNTAPEITTPSLSFATVNTPYSATVSATDAEGDALTYSIVDGPSWLSINSSGRLSGTPTTSGTSTVEVKVTDAGGLYDTASYSLFVASVASVDMYVYNAGGSAIGGDAVDDACSVEVILTNTSSGYSVSATAVSGVASFSLDETGTYDIEVPSTNSGSNCYGGFAQAEWLDVSSGSNTSWVHLIPEDNQSQVQSVVGSQLDMGDVYGHASGDVDSLRDLVVYMVEVDSRAPDMYGWNSSIRTGAYDLEVEDFNGYTYTSIDYDAALVDAVGYWDGYLAPSISIVSSGSGGDIYFTLTGNWQTDVNMSESSSGIWTIDDVEIDYGGVGDYETCVATTAHEMGHSFFNHTNVDGFIMHQSFAGHASEPHELELLVARTLNNIGYESPRGEPINLFSGYTE